MGFLDNSTVTVDAILTKKGRELLSRDGNFNITKFALSDEEIDYTLFDVTHPNGTDSYGAVIENMSLLEAAPNRTDFNSFLVNTSIAGAKLLVGYPATSTISFDGEITLSPVTKGGGGIEEEYTFTVVNTGILNLVGGTNGVITAKTATLTAQSFSDAGNATTAVTILGETSGLRATINVTVETDPTSNTTVQSNKENSTE